MDRDRGNWDHWMTRIPKDDSDCLQQLGKILVQKHLIPNNDRYNIGRWALTFALNRLEEEYRQIKERKAKTMSNQ